MEDFGKGGALDTESALWAKLLAAEAANAVAAGDFRLSLFDNDCLGGADVAAYATADT